MNSAIVARMPNKLAAYYRSKFSMRTRRRVAFARLSARSRLAFMRGFPSFLIIGAQRSGTSSLYKYLSSHPDIAGSLRKEVEYFTLHYEKGESWYRAHFATKLSGKFHTLVTRHPKLSFEASPNYLFWPTAASRAAGLLPDAKLIAILRNPIDRAYSHYDHNYRHGIETLSFYGAILAEEQRLAAGSDLLYERFSYVQRGMYATQLANWLNHFDRRQLLVIAFEDLIDSPQAVLADVFGFLEVRPWLPKEYKNFSYPGGVRPSIPPMMAHTRAVLRASYESEVQQLYSLLGRDLHWAI